MTERIVVRKIGTETLVVPLIGLTPLIVHNFSEKAKRQMLEAQQGHKRLKEARDPEAEYRAAFYRIADPEHPGGERYGFPVTAFKAATIGAARFYDKSVSMTALRQVLFMQGELTKADPQQLVAIVGEPEMREDVVRLSGPSRSADLRYRPGFMPWSANLIVTYVTSSIDRDSVVSLIDAGGLGVGVGEWRPEKRGEFGTYCVDAENVRGVQVLG
jgi:hypothetical protein